MAGIGKMLPRSYEGTISDVRMYVSDEHSYCPDRGPAVLHKGEAVLLESRQFQIEEICRVFSVKRESIGI